MASMKPLTSPHASVVPSSPDEPKQPRGVCEPDEAIRRLGGLPDLYAAIVGRLLDDASGVFARLRAAVADENASQAHAHAHSLKGLALMCGAVSLADAAKALEEAGRHGACADLKKLLERLEVEMELARILLTPYR